MRHHTLLLATLAILAPSMHSADAQTTQADLRAYTEYAARTGKVSLPRPRLDWDRDPLVYVFDDTIPVDLLDAERTTVLDAPLNAQFTVTAIRTYRDTPRQRQFWTPVLGRVEAEITEMLNVINEGEVKGNELRELLQEKSNDIAEIYSKELDRLAKANGKRGAVTEYRIAFHFVDLATNPVGGTISYMPAGRWNLYLFMTQRRNRPDYPKPNWITIRQTEDVPLAGKNWFSIKWPNGANHKELVRIANDRPITFTPTGS